MAEAISEDTLKTALQEKLQAQHVEVTDMSGTSGALLAIHSSLSVLGSGHADGIGGCGQAFTAVIVSPQFVGLNRLKRHRLVNTALREEIASIHAWSAKCHAPDEWTQEAAKAGSGGDTVVASS